MPLVLRNTKGSELTFSELDGNFSFLETEINSNASSISTILTNKITSLTTTLTNKAGFTVAVNDAEDGFILKGNAYIYGVEEDNTAVTNLVATDTYADADVDIIANGDSSGVSLSLGTIKNDTTDTLDVEILTTAGIGSVGTNSDRFVLNWSLNGVPLKGRGITTSNNNEDGGTAWISRAQIPAGDSVVLRIKNADNGSNVTVKEVTVKLNEIK